MTTLTNMFAGIGLGFTVCMLAKITFDLFSYLRHNSK